MFSDEMLAHYDKETNRKQYLIEHLFNTAEYGRKISKVIGVGNISFLLGLLHDSGKAEPLFQEKLLNGKEQMKVVHSTAGAYFLYKNFLKRNECMVDDRAKFDRFIEMCMYVIEAHHGLFDTVGEKCIKFDDHIEEYRRVNFIYEKIKNYTEDDRYSIDYVEEYISSVIEENLKSLCNPEITTIADLVKVAFYEYSLIENKINESIKKNERNISLDKANSQRIERLFFEAALIRLFLSILKTADVRDTINAYGKTIKEVDKENERETALYLRSSIERTYEEYSKCSGTEKPINKIRTKIAETMKKRGETDEEGIYRLDVPTGSGKTKSALRYAFHQVEKKSKTQVFYITAFLSVLEQNASEIRKIIGDKYLLEHHSNIDLMDRNIKEVHSIDGDGTEDAEYAGKAYIVESWDSPVVATTMVQFFNSLLKGKSANIRRFAALINSVIIIDEVQSLPIEVTYFFNSFINFLKIIMKCNVILYTATQPMYDAKDIEHKMWYGDPNGNLADLVKLSDNEKMCFKRCKVSKLKKGNEISTIDEIAKFVSCDTGESKLVIVNTKRAAREVAKGIIDAGIPNNMLYFLSTDLCPAHRKQTIKEIKEKLTAKEKIICVSTQLIEAGVDVDFDMVVRSYAGIDSIIQAIGRANREGNIIGGGKAVLVNLSENIENTSGILGLGDKKKIAQDLLKNLEGEIEIDKLNDSFYLSYYSLKANERNIMGTPIGIDALPLFDCLSKPQILKRNLAGEKGNVFHLFRTVAEKFELIKDEKESVFVYYGEGKDKLNELIGIANKVFLEWEDYGKIKQLTKELQPYSINVFEKSKLDRYIDSYLYGGIKVLNIDRYSEKYGANEEFQELLIK